MPVCSAPPCMRAPDLASMTTFAKLLHEILGREMELHRSYCAEFGITPLDLELEPKAPTTQGYTDFLLRTSTTGDYAELLGALLPCMWGYSEVGTALAARGLPDDDRYRRWINVYADPEFAELATWCRAPDRRGVRRAPVREPGSRRTRVHHLQPLRAGLLGNGLDAGILAGLTSTQQDDLVGEPAHPAGRWTCGGQRRDHAATHRVTCTDKMLCLRHHLDGCRGQPAPLDRVDPGCPTASTRTNTRIDRIRLGTIRWRVDPGSPLTTTGPDPMGVRHLSVQMDILGAPTPPPLCGSHPRVAATGQIRDRSGRSGPHRGMSAT